MSIILKPYQRECIDRLRDGSVLAAGVGSGKSIMSIWWYLEKCCGVPNGGLPKKGAPDLYIITTAKKRDSLGWEDDLIKFAIVTGENPKAGGVTITVDSWNNVHKYTDVKDSVFIFDEQRAVGSGKWAKSFIKIAKQNHWILCSATPADKWEDWCSVFIANGFYRNKTEYYRRHAVYARYSSFPRVERWVDLEYPEKCRDRILVTCVIPRETTRHYIDVHCEYDKQLIKQVMKERVNPDTNEPFLNASQLCYWQRNTINTHRSRLKAALTAFKHHPRLVVFYTLKSELGPIKELSEASKRPFFQYNGQVHDPVPTGDRWIYAVQYTAGAEAWNCTTTNAMVFWDLPYSYRMYEQAQGRIDRINTKYKDLYYYKMFSYAPIDTAIRRALSEKKDFNVRGFIRAMSKTK